MILLSVFIFWPYTYFFFSLSYDLDRSFGTKLNKISDGKDYFLIVHCEENISLNC